MVTIRAAAVGWRARRALRRSGGVARRLGAAAGYLEAAGEILWLGATGAPLHGRAVLADEVPRASDVVVDLAAARLWRPPLFERDPAPATLAAAAGRLRSALNQVGEPLGLGTLLVGRAPEFPLASSRPAARELARACAAWARAGRGARDEAAAAVRAAAALIGLGPGLTPSGDDFVGGALFARALLTRGAADAAWCRAVAEVRALARARTHPVSAALLADLAGGQGWAPLHALVGTLAAGGGAAAIGPAREVTRIGHSSGWDLLAGLLTALTGGRGL